MTADMDKNARTRERRERRRRQAVRGFLLDQLEALDGVRYTRPDGHETHEDATACPFCYGRGYAVVPDGDGCFVKEPCACEAVERFLALGVRK